MRAINFVILAAGSGTRMKSNIPKIFHRVANFTMLEVVADVVRKTSSRYDDVLINKLIITSDYILSNFRHLLPSDFEIVVQNNPQGTGHAMQVALPYLIKEDSITVMLYADTPLVTDYELVELVNLLDYADISVLGFNCKSELDQYGRLITNHQGQVIEIIEYKDASEQQRKNKLCNSGIMSFRTVILEEFLPQLNNNNKNNEYYVVDIIRLAKENNHRTFLVMSDLDSMGANNQVELSELNKIVQLRIQSDMMFSGVTIVDQSNTFISYDAIIPPGVTISPFVYIDRGVNLTGVPLGYVIKPFSVINQDNLKEYLGLV